MSVLKGWEKREIGENYATMLTIDKTAKARKPRKRGAGAESARYGKREIWTQ